MNPAPARARTFAPGRVNLIGEHTDYNQGLALPFAIEAGVTATAEALDERVIEALARGPGRVRQLPDRASAAGSRLAGVRPRHGCRVDASRRAGARCAPRDHGERAARRRAVLVGGLRDRPRDGADCGVGCARPGAHRARAAVLAGRERMGRRANRAARPAGLAVRRARPCAADRLPLARGRARAAVDWTAAGWSRSTPASTTPTPPRVTTSVAPSARAPCELLALDSLREASAPMARELPHPLDRRALHVISENERVELAVEALGRRDLDELGRLIDASHASLRDFYEISTPAVEATVERLRPPGRSARGSSAVDSAGTCSGCCHPVPTRPRGRSKSIRAPARAAPPSGTRASPTRRSPPSGTAPRSPAPGRRHRRGRAAARPRRGSRARVLGLEPVGVRRPGARSARPALAAQLDHRRAAVPRVVEEQRPVLADDLELVARRRARARHRNARPRRRRTASSRRTRRRRRRRRAPARRSPARARRRAAASPLTQ